MGRTIPRLVCSACLCVLGACTNRPPTLLPSAPAPGFGAFVTADALVRRGCYACLTEALSIYEELAADPAFPAARLRAADTAILVALREREIGLGARDGRKQAGAIASSLPVPYNLAPYLEMLDVVPWKPGSISKERQDEMVGGYGILTSSAPEWRRLLQRDGHRDLVRASLRLSLECSFRSSLTGRDTPDPWRPSSDAPPLVRFRSAICQGNDTSALADMLAADPRFAEIDLFLGESAFGQGRLVEAERHMLPAFDAFPDLAVAASYLGSIYMAMEDFDEGLVYYQKAVGLIPGNREALLGQMKLLSYLGRSEDAVRVASQMIDLGTWYMGDAYYWRAWNRQRQSDWEGAWADLQEAKKYLPMDGAVAKLTGLIALGRGDPVRAHEEFRIAIRYNDKDSDAWFYLASVLSTQKRWKESADFFLVAEPLYAKDEEALRAKIKEIAASKLGDARKARLTTAKERQVAATRLQQARCAFSAAAGYFNIGDFAKAQPLAERAAAYPELSESARKLLERLPKMP